MDDLYEFTGDGNCRACEAAILWFRTPAGKSVPVNDGAPGLPMLGRGDQVDGAIVRAAYHFATCPEASRFRKSRR